MPSSVRYLQRPENVSLVFSHQGSLNAASNSLHNTRNIILAEKYKDSFFASFMFYINHVCFGPKTVICKNLCVLAVIKS